MDKQENQIAKGYRLSTETHRSLSCPVKDAGCQFQTNCDNTLPARSGVVLFFFSGPEEATEPSVTVVLWV